MKQANLFNKIVLATSILFLLSCNSNKDKKTDETTTTDSSTVNVNTADTPPSVVTPSGPTSLVVVKHKVTNYAKWLPAYEANDSMQLANGIHKYIIARGTEDSNTVMIAMIMDDVEKAKAMGNSAELKNVMKKAGVVGAPTITYLQAVMNDTSALTSTTRLLVTHKVKDWDAWKKVFDEHKQVRMDAGLTDRVLGHANGDNKNVSIVFAVSDEAKAKAFINSQDLKDKMQAAGVDGKPEFFFYQVVKKY